MRGLDTVIEYANKITEIAFVSCLQDDFKPVDLTNFHKTFDVIEVNGIQYAVKKINVEEVFEINKLAYKIYKYLVALKMILEEPEYMKKLIEEGRFNTNLLEL